MIRLCRILTAAVVGLSVASWWAIDHGNAAQFSLLSLMMLSMVTMPAHTIIRPERLEDFHEAKARDYAKWGAAVSLMVLSTGMAVVQMATESVVSLSDLCMSMLAGCGMMNHIGVMRIATAGGAAGVATAAAVCFDLDRIAALTLLLSSAVIVLMTVMWRRGNRARV